MYTLKSRRKSINLSTLSGSGNAKQFLLRLYRAICPDGEIIHPLGDISVAYDDARKILSRIKSLPGYKDLDSKLENLRLGTLACCGFAGLGDEKDRIEIALRYFKDCLQEDFKNNGAFDIEKYAPTTKAYAI